MLSLLWLSLLACKGDEETTYVQFNGDDDTLVVEIGAADLLDAVTIDLTSSTGEVTVGTGTVDPGGGPIGTEHEVVVIVDDDYEDRVDRVSVRIDSGDRGEDEYDLEPDSADEGYHKLILVSVGEDGETRSDSLTFRLWEAEESEAETEESTSDETDEEG